jgi:hypothetical protein
MVSKKNVIIIIIVAAILIGAAWTFVYLTRPSLSMAQQKLVTASEIMPGPGPFQYSQYRPPSEDFSFKENQSDEAQCNFDNNSVDVQVWLYIFVTDSDCQKAMNKISQDVGNETPISIGDEGFITKVVGGCWYGHFAVNNKLFEINEQSNSYSQSLPWIEQELVRIASVQADKLA